MSWERTIDDALDDADYILEAVRDVRDSEVKPSEYDFLDDLEKVHPAPAKKGNDGLANFVANLAIYKENYEDESVEIDQELIKEADRRIGEADGLKNPARRKRINNIVQESDSRGGNKESMQYNIEERNLPDGHIRLIEQASAIYKAAGKEDEGREKIQNILKDTDLSLNDTNWDISNSGPENLEKLKGGETIMTSIEEMAGDIEESVDEIYAAVEALPGEETYDELRSDLDELKDRAEAAKDDYFEVRSELTEAHDEIETIYDSLESAHERVEEASEYVDRAATATGHALDDAVSEMESALEEGVDQVDEAQGYMQEILDDDIPDMPDRPDRVEEQLS